MQQNPTTPVTGLHHFHKANPNGDTLFSVREGVPLGDAFDHLTTLLAAAQAGAENIALCDDVERAPAAAWSVYHLLTFAIELTQSMHQGIGDHEQATCPQRWCHLANGEGVSDEHPANQRNTLRPFQATARHSFSWACCSNCLR